MCKLGFESNATNKKDWFQLESHTEVFGGFMQSLVNLDYVTKSPNSPCLEAFLKTFSLQQAVSMHHLLRNCGKIMVFKLHIEEYTSIRCHGGVCNIMWPILYQLWSTPKWGRMKFIRYSRIRWYCNLIIGTHSLFLYIFEKCDLIHSKMCLIWFKITCDVFPCKT
jgi:hypothetical protein